MTAIRYVISAHTVPIQKVLHLETGKHTCTKHLKPVKADEVCDDFECFLREKHMTEAPGYSPIIKYFAYEHLPERLQGVSKQIGDLARELDKTLPDGPEKTAGLRKLLESQRLFSEGESVKATEVLEECSKILAERGAQRDKPNGERAMPLCIELFRLRTGLELSEQQGYIFMECLKNKPEKLTVLVLILMIL